MKKFGLMALIVAVTCAMNAENVTQIDSTNMVGMTCFTSSLSELPIGVVYGDYSVTNVEMSVTNLLWTGNLEEDDTLYIYDYAQDRYVSMSLTNQKTWKADKVDGGTKLDIDTERFKFGRGAWLCRQCIEDREDKNVYTFGQVPVGQVTVTIQAGGETTSMATLIASPLSEPFDVNGGAVDWSSVAVAGDALFLPQENGTLKTYLWNASSGKWYAYSGGKPVTTGIVVPRARGFWYSRAKGKPSAEITWNLLRD